MKRWGPVPTEADPGTGEVSMISGISAGWADGYYLIQTVADPERTVRESGRRNNVGWTHVRLCGDEAEIVGMQKRCA